MSVRFLVALLFPISTACAQNVNSDGIVTYRDRAIDVRAYVEGFPYKSFYFAPAEGKVFFLHRGDQERLQEADFSAGSPVDFSKSRPLSQIDFTKRNFWGLAVSSWNKRVYIKGDEDNSEVINLYELQTSGALKKLTAEGYVYDWELSPDGRRIAFAARSSNREFSPGSVGIVDLATGKVHKIFHDSKALRMTWTNVNWKPDGSAVLLSAVCNEDRTHQDLLLIKADGSGSRRLLDCKTKKSVRPAWEWADDDNLIFTSNEAGNRVAYRLNLPSGKRTRLTDPAWNLVYAQLVGPRLIALERRPIGSALHVLDASSGRLLSSREFPASLELLRGNRSTALLLMNSPTVPFEIHALTLQADEARLSKIVEYDDDLKKKVVHCEAQKVSYATFDGLAAPGESGTLHAFLYTPKNQAIGREARLLVNAFYGGTNSYSPKVHMFCQAGFHVLSPAPRGSWEWGREFHDKVQGDLGGAEILDILEGAKAFSARLGIPPAQVGAFGGSHGGYATLRALTFPDAVNGHAPGFRFGFGLSDYGISNLVRYVRSTNIAGWISDMTIEDPVKNPAKWLDRSPETGACRAHGPLFLSHGTNDKRVGIEESRGMMQALKQCGRTRDVYFELPGQGHGYKGTAALVAYYRALFGFMEDLTPAETARH